jgi:hypothetical protein
MHHNPPQFSIPLYPICYFPFTVILQLFVPPLIREQITNTCDDAYFIIVSYAMPFVSHKSPNECLFYHFLKPAQNFFSCFLFAPPLSDPSKSSSPFSMTHSFGLDWKTHPSQSIIICKESRAAIRPSKKSKRILTRGSLTCLHSVFSSVPPVPCSYGAFFA